MKTILSLSGGADSATLLAFLLASGHEVVPVIFQYGAKHNEYEVECARKLCFYYNLEPHIVDVTGIFYLFESDLLVQGGDIPEGHYEADNMASTVVPNRNMIFASILGGVAVSQKADAIALGVHAGDHHIYPDCRPEFVRIMQHALRTATDTEMTVITPFLYYSKGRIIACGTQLAVPYEMTRTCYKAQEDPCGKCGSCVERAEAFAENNIGDPALQPF